MLKILNDLAPFFEDCYRRIGVREYARIAGVSPPTASAMLSSYEREGLLLRRPDRNSILFYANRESTEFVGLSRLYWARRLSGIVSLMEKELVCPAVILFGSLSKTEANPDSDVDLAVFAVERAIDVKPFEKDLGRRIQLLWFGSFSDVKSKELAGNIIRGEILSGRLSF